MPAVKPPRRKAGPAQALFGAGSGFLGAAIAALLLLGAASVGADETAATCFNQLQLIATHNSYHRAPDPQYVSSLLANPLVKAVLPADAFLPYAWEYTHLPIEEQLERGVRGFELDLHADPSGGLYSTSAGLRLAGLNGFLSNPVLKQPGFKVLHVPDFDFNSSCVTFKECLGIFQRWSEAHPDHLPVTIFLESKRPLDLTSGLGAEAAPLIRGFLEQQPAPGPGSLALTPRLNVSLLEDIEAEILEVFNQSAILTPDDVRGGDPTLDLRKLLLADPASGACPWPDLDLMRGKVLFAIMLSDAEIAMYEELHPQQEGAVMWLAVSGRQLRHQAVFVTAASWGIGQGLDKHIPPNASGIVEGIAESVRSLVRQGYMVRPRADADTIEARANFTLRRDAMLATGAQYVATDYLEPSQIFPSSYKVDVPEM